MEEGPMNKKTKKTKGVGGITTARLVIPVAVLLVILHTSMIVSIVRINNASGRLSAIMAEYGRYVNEATDLQAGSTILSETFSSFILHPTVQGENGVETNVGPLISYATEYVKERRGNDIKNKICSYNVNEESKTSITKAAESAEKCNVIQSHAIELIRAVYPFPPIPALNAIPRYTLSDEEMAYGNEEKLSLAYDLLAGTEYSDQKRIISENVNVCRDCLRQEMETKSEEQIAVVALARSFLWGTTFGVIAILLFVFFFVVNQLVAPLRGYVRGIESSDMLDRSRGLHEVRLLAKSYNELLEKKNAMERLLRSAAETDTLTDLPNRYYFEQYMTRTGEKGPVALLLFDVNYLKLTNDREGHLAGDDLLKRAARCIKESFGSLPESVCFRYGGDEFAVIVRNCKKDQIEKTVCLFTEKQKENNVSIALGYAYTKDIGITSYHSLFSEADKEMYVQKSIIHDRDNEKKE